MSTRATQPNPNEVFYTAEQMAAREAQHAAEIATLEQEEMSPEERVHATLRDIQSDARAMVKLYHRGVGNKISWCADYPVAEFDAAGFEMIRREWGAGAYQIRLIGSTGVKGKVDIDIRERANNPIATQPQNTEMAQVLRMLAEGQQQLLAAVTARPEVVNPMQSMKDMLELQVLMRSAMGAGEAKSGIMEAVEALRTLQGAAKELLPQPVEEKEESMLDMASKMLPSILGAMQGQQAQPPQQLAIPATFANAPAPEHAVNPNQPDLPGIDPAAPADESQEMNFIQQQLFNAIMKQIMKMAVAKAEPDDAADFIEENAPGAVVEFLRADEWWSLLSAARPDVAPHKEWFEKVRASLLDDGEETEVAK